MWWRRTTRSVLGVPGTPLRSQGSSFGGQGTAVGSSSSSNNQVLNQSSEAYPSIGSSPPYVPDSVQMLDGDDQRSLWMPDEKCTVCFGCSRTFHAFRRKHHCRICGRIFCYRCSNHFVKGQHRVCDHCHSALVGPPYCSSLRIVSSSWLVRRRVYICLSRV